VLRELTEEDIPQTLEITRFDGKPPRDLEEANQMIRKIRAECLEGKLIHWAIETRETGEIVGTCGYYRGFENGAGEIGYILLEKFRGQGFMTEVVNAAVEFGFQTMKLSQVFAITSAKNQASQNVLTKCGFITDGVPDEKEDIRFERLA